MKVGVGYQIGPVNQPFPDNLLNVYVRGKYLSVYKILFADNYDDYTCNFVGYFYILYHFPSPGIIQTQHTTLFSPDMAPFSRLQGNINAQCPDVQAPPTSTLFEPVSISF